MKFSIFNAEKHLCILHGQAFVMFQAGIKRKNLAIALESEAASVWCQTIPLDKSQATVSKKGTKYMTCDLGGKHLPI